jgi:hypothetical protein
VVERPPPPKVEVKQANPWPRILISLLVLGVLAVGGLMLLK